MRTRIAIRYYMAASTLSQLKPSKLTMTLPSLPIKVLCGMYLIPYDSGALPPPCMALPFRLFASLYFSASPFPCKLTSTMFTLPLYLSSAAFASSSCAAGPQAGQKLQ